MSNDTVVCEGNQQQRKQNISHLTHLTLDHYHIHHWPVLHVFAIFSNKYYISGGLEGPPKINMTPPPPWGGGGLDTNTFFVFEDMETLLNRVKG